MTVRIEIDHSKCTKPLECGKCLKVCPMAVFIAYPLHREPEKICDDWSIESTFEDLCTACNLCVEVCPKSALKLTPCTQDKSET